MDYHIHGFPMWEPLCSGKIQNILPNTGSALTSSGGHAKTIITSLINNVTQYVETGLQAPNLCVCPLVLSNTEERAWNSAWKYYDCKKYWRHQTNKQNDCLVHTYKSWDWGGFLLPETLWAPVTGQIFQSPDSSSLTTAVTTIPAHQETIVLVTDQHLY